ncbi:MAG: OmpA family protein [Deltaproteobacteria bacterium]
MRRVAVLLAAMAALGILSGGCTRFESTYLRKVNEAEGLSRELSALNGRYRQLEGENRSLKDRIAALSGDLEAIRGERDHLRSSLEFVTGERDRLAADRQELERTLSAKADSLSRTVVDLRRRIADLEKENRDLGQRIADLKKAQEEKVETVSKTYEGLMSKMEEEIRQGQITISELKGKLTLNMVDAILFDTGKAQIKPEGIAVLDKIVSILRDEREKAIRVEGHTDNVPIAGVLAKTYPTNWELSAARAIGVTRYLQQQGIPPGLLSAVAYGEFRPVADNDTPEGRAKNRRIEIVLAPRE